MHKNYYAQLQDQAAGGRTGMPGYQNQPPGYEVQPDSSSALTNPFAAAQQQQQQQTNPFGQVQQSPHPQQQVHDTFNQPIQQSQQQQVQHVQHQLPAGYEEPTIDYTLFNSDKSLLRCTTDRIPSTTHAIRESGIPYGLIVKPYGDMGEDVPTVSFKNDPIVRCRDCRAYINPFVKWLENGQKWICPFCGDINVTEQYYYSTIEADGYRTDHDSRPEFSCGTVDFIANHEYMNRPPMPPTYLFAFDVSKPAIDSGYLAFACSSIKSVIEQSLLPGQSSDRVKIAFITYDNNVQFYNLKQNLKQPQMLVMTDVESFFMPQPDDLLVNLSESYDLIINLLDNLPNYFSKTHTVESCFVAALQCANSIIKTIGGKMVFFQVSQMILRHPKLQPANNPTNPPKAGVERLDLWQSVNGFFKNTGIELAHGQISFDLFSFTSGPKKQYKNLKIFSDLPGHSSGNLYHYPDFNPRTHGLKFSNELYHNISRKISWEAVFRIRLSQGYNQLDSYGNIQIKAKTQDLVLAPTMDQDRVIMYEFEKTEDAQVQDQYGRQARISKRFLFVQSALLYSSSDGQRRIRCHNIAIPITQHITEAYDFLDIVATSSFLTRKAIARFNKMINIEASRQVVESAAINMIRGQMKALKHERGQQFQLSDNMQYFLMYTMGVLKSLNISLPAIMGPNDLVDKLTYERFLINHFSADEITGIYSPQIILISNPDLNEAEFPPLESLERFNIRTDQIYLLYNSINIYMYVGRNCDPYFLQEIFQVQEVTRVDKDMSEDEIFAKVLANDGSASQYLLALYGLIGQIRFQRQPFCQLNILIEGEVESEHLIQSLCIIDTTANSRYNIDYTKFINKIQGQASQGAGQQAQGPVGGMPATQQVGGTPASGGTTGYY